jgi:hypothetical protein
MEIRWLAHLDDTNVLRLWRSWIGHQIYQAVLERQAANQWVIRELAVGRCCICETSGRAEVGAGWRQIAWASSVNAAATRNAERASIPSS